MLIDRTNAKREIQKVLIEAGFGQHQYSWTKKGALKILIGEDIKYIGLPKNISVDGIEEIKGLITSLIRRQEAYRRMRRERDDAVVSKNENKTEEAVATRCN